MPRHWRSLCLATRRRCSRSARRPRPGSTRERGPRCRSRCRPHELCSLRAVRTRSPDRTPTTPCGGHRRAHGRGPILVGGHDALAAHADLHGGLGSITPGPVAGRHEIRLQMEVRNVLPCRAQRQELEGRVGVSSSAEILAPLDIGQKLCGLLRKSRRPSSSSLC